MITPAKPGILKIAINTKEDKMKMYRSLFFPHPNEENFKANNGISDTSKYENTRMIIEIIIG